MAQGAFVCLSRAAVTNFVTSSVRSAIEWKDTGSLNSKVELHVLQFTSVFSEQERSITCICDEHQYIQHAVYAMLNGTMNDWSNGWPAVPLVSIGTFSRNSVRNIP